MKSPRRKPTYNPAGRYKPGYRDRPLSFHLSRYEPDPFGGCWLYTGHVDKDGYGRVIIARKHHKAHRFFYEALVGPIPEGKIICHKCDVRCCVNPQHHYPGTREDNSRDAVVRGRLFGRRAARGEQSGSAKLTDAQAIEIWHSTLPYRELRQLYGVGYNTLTRIKTGAGWAHLTAGLPPAGRSSEYFSVPDMLASPARQASATSAGSGVSAPGAVST